MLIREAKKITFINQRSREELQTITKTKEMTGDEWYKLYKTTEARVLKRCCDGISVKAR
jgi:hypothetical protein